VTTIWQQWYIPYELKFVYTEGRIVPPCTRCVRLGVICHLNSDIKLWAETKVSYVTSLCYSMNCATTLPDCFSLTSFSCHEMKGVFEVCTSCLETNK